MKFDEISVEQVKWKTYGNVFNFAYAKCFYWLFNQFNLLLLRLASNPQLLERRISCLGWMKFVLVGRIMISHDPSTIRRSSAANSPPYVRPEDVRPLCN